MFRDKDKNSDSGLDQNDFEENLDNVNNHQHEERNHKMSPPSNYSVHKLLQSNPVSTMNALFLVVSFSYMLPWTALGSLISYYKNEYDADFYVLLYCCFYLPGLPVALLQQRYDIIVDAVFSSKTTYLWRGIISFISLSTLVFLLVFSSNQYQLLIIFSILGAFTWYIHGSACMLASMFHPSAIAWLQTGFRCPEIYTVVAVSVLGIGKSASTTSLNIFYCLSAFLTIIGLISWLYISLSDISSNYFEQKDNNIMRLKSDNSAENSPLLSPRSQLHSHSRHSNNLHSNSNLSSPEQHHQQHNQHEYLQHSNDSLSASTEGESNDDDDDDDSNNDVNNDDNYDNNNHNKHNNTTHHQQQQPDPYYIDNSDNHFEQGYMFNHNDTNSTISQSPTQVSPNDNNNSSSKTPDKKHFKSLSTKNYSNNGNTSPSTKTATTTTMKEKMKKKISRLYSQPLDRAKKLLKRVNSIMHEIHSHESQWVLCAALFITLWCSIFQSSFFAFVTSSRGRNIEQILYFVRLFSDLLGRPLARLIRPWFLKRSVDLLYASLIRVLLMVMFFVYILWPKCPQSDVFICCLVSIFSILSGYLSVLVYEYAAALHPDKTSQVRVTVTLNSTFQLAAFTAVVMSIGITKFNLV